MTSDGFETSTGTLYVSKPYRSKSSKKLRAQITFAPRSSAFDINNEHSGSNEFRVRSCLALVPTLTFSLGFLLTVLDLNIYLYSPNICPKHRSKWTSTQPSFCHNVFSRCYHIGSKWCCTRSQHWHLCTICNGHKKRMDTLLLDGIDSATSTSDFSSFRSNHLDFQ